MRDVVSLGGSGLGGEGGVEVGDVGLVVLRVVQLHDLLGDDGLQSLDQISHAPFTGP